MRVKMRMSSVPCGPSSSIWGKKRVLRRLKLKLKMSGENKGKTWWLEGVRVEAWDEQWVVDGWMDGWMSVGKRCGVGCRRNQMCG